MLRISDTLRAEVRTAMRRLTTEFDGHDQQAVIHFGVNRTDLHVIETLRTRGPLVASERARRRPRSRGLSIAVERLERTG